MARQNRNWLESVNKATLYSRTKPQNYLASSPKRRERPNSRIRLVTLFEQRHDIFRMVIVHLLTCLHSQTDYPATSLDVTYDSHQLLPINLVLLVLRATP